MDAIYDISAHTVYLPMERDWKLLGLGDRLDDPRHVHERMRGATPPDVYELAPREQLFHGVQALRLKPVAANVFDGQVSSHTLTCSPERDSNGCVVFKNYEAFLQHFKMRGQTSVVVAHLD